MNDEELIFVMKMRDEASRVLKKFNTELKSTGGVSKTLSDEMKRTNAAFKDADQLLGRLGDTADDTSGSMKGLAGQIGQMVSGAATLYALKRSVESTMKSFMIMQDGMSEVRKTSGLSGRDLEDVKVALDEIGRAVPVPMEQLYEFTAVAGRAGVTGKEALGEFAKTAAQMSVALDNIDPDVLLRALGNTREALDENGGVQGNMKTFAATLNLLDDTSKTSASKILELATDVAAAGSQFNLSYKDVLAWSTVLAESGVDAGIASTTILRMGSTIQQAAALGGDQLQLLAATAGMTAEQFKQLADRDVAGAINSLINGMSQMDAGQRIGVLKALELDAVMSQKAINVLTGKVDVLHDRIRQVNDEPLAMAKFDAENEAQLDKFSSQLQLLKNNFQQLKAAIGADFADAFLPIVQALADMTISLTEWYGSLDDGTQKFIAFATAITVGGAGVVLSLGQMGLAIRGMSVLAGALGISGVAAGGGITAMLAAAGPAVAVIAALGATMYIFADSLALGSSNIMEAAGASAEGAAKLKEYEEQARVAAASQQTVSYAADTMGERLAYARTHVWNLDQALKNLGITAQWSAFQMAKAQLAENKMNLAKVRGNKALFGSMPVVGAAFRGAYETREKQLLEEQGDIYTSMVYAAGDAFNTGMATARGGPKIDQPPTATPGTFTPSGKTDGGGRKTGGGGESQAVRDMKARAEALRDVQFETREANDMYNSLLAGYGDSIDKIEEEKAIIAARWALRKREGKDNLDLTKDEILATRAKVVADKQVNDLLAQREREAESRLGTDMLGVEALGRASIGFGDTRENAVANALLEERLILIRETRDVTAQLSIDEEEYIRTSTEMLWDRNEAEREYNRLKEQDYATFDLFSSSLGDMLSGAKSLKGALGDLVTGLRDLAIQFLILIPLKRAFETSYSAGGGFFGALSSAFGAMFANGGGFNKGVQFFAKGDVFDRPTAFGMRGGVGVMGEAGPEAIMPLRRGRDGKLGVQMSGGGGGFSIGSLVVNVEAPDGSDPAMFGRIIGEAIEAKMAQFARKESRPGGMLYRS